MDTATPVGHPLRSESAKVAGRSASGLPIGPITAFDIPLDVLVSHELGHAACAAHLGLRVVAIELPTIITQADDGSGHYGRKARTSIEDMYLEDAPGVNRRLNSRIRTELAAVAVAGAVAELLLEGQPGSTGLVYRRLQILRNRSDFDMLPEILGVNSVRADDVGPHVERAKDALAPSLKSIRTAVRPIVATMIQAMPDALTWAELQTHLQT
jgi:hypothetical protein